MAGCNQTHHVLQWTRVVYHLESVSIRAETALLLRRSREIVIQNADQSHIFVAIAYLIINEHTTFSSGYFISLHSGQRLTIEYHVRSASGPRGTASSQHQRSSRGRHGSPAIAVT